MSSPFVPCPQTLELMVPLSTSPSKIDHNNMSYCLQLRLGSSFLTVDEILKIVVSPEAQKTQIMPLLMMRTATGVMTPAHLPNIGDMFGMVDVKALKERLAKTLENCPKVHRLPTELHGFFNQIIDPKPVIDTTLPLYSLQSESKVVKVGSFTDGLCVFAVDAKMTAISMIVEVGVEGEAPSNRFHKVTLTPEMPSGFPNLNRGSKIAIWNARGLSRPSFEENLGILVQAYNPCVLVVTEARIATLSMKKIWRARGIQMEWDLDETCSLEGGVAILWDRTRAHAIVKLAPPRHPIHAVVDIIGPMERTVGEPCG